MNASDRGLFAIIGAETTEPPKETVGEALRKVTPSLIIVALVGGLAAAVGGAIAQGVIHALVKDKR